jgi:lipopolysaccharide export system protein LptA
MDRITRLRRWLALIAIVMIVIVASMYFYARWRVRNALKDLPGKIDVNIQQTAQGFKVSKSEQGRTIFTVQASKAVQFKKGGRTELHDVSIILYGRDASRFDQIYGDDFEYDPQSGDAKAGGEVRIDLEAIPAGLTNPDQSPPKELRNPIHLKTSGLVFNQKTGNASTDQKIEFRNAQASGSAVGVHYTAKDQVLTLDSHVEIDVLGPNAAHITAMRAIITKEPRNIELIQPKLVRNDQQVTARRATLFLDDKNTVERVLAQGDVQGQAHGKSEVTGRSDSAEFFLGEKGSALRNAVLSGNVQLASTGAQVANASAGRIILDFAGKKDLQKVHAERDVRLRQQQSSQASGGDGKSQDVEIAAEAMDAFLDRGHLDRAQTAGAGQITITQASSAQKATITAAKFEARFDDKNHLKTLHGAPDARITTVTPNQPDRVSTSDTLDVSFRPAGGIETIVQQGNLVYIDGDRKAWADRARYTPSDQLLALTGSPRITEAGFSTTATTMTLNRTTGSATAEGSVKSTYSDLKPQPNGALLASSAPIHVTSRKMTANRSPSKAIYTGGARLWQNANAVEAPTIEFDRDARSVVASSNGSKVSTVLVESDKNGKAMPVTITSGRLSYVDSERRVRFEGGVLARGADMTLTSQRMDAFLSPAGTGATAGTDKADLAGVGAGRVEKIVAQGDVAITQNARKATGGQLVYTVAEDKFVLTGGPPSIFDAEHGKITGDSLTFYKRDDRVLVEGSDSSPTSTTIRVAR